LNQATKKFVTGLGKSVILIFSVDPTRHT